MGAESPVLAETGKSFISGVRPSVRACVRPSVRPSGAFRASLREIFRMFAAISPIARDLSKIHARSGLGVRLVSLCTAFPALGVDSVRYAHDFRAMRFCLPIRLGMAGVCGPVCRKTPLCAMLAKIVFSPQRNATSNTLCVDFSCNLLF